jgi:transcriptional regulator with XRE-family HTH domain
MNDKKQGKQKPANSAKSRNTEIKPEDSTTSFFDRVSDATSSAFKFAKKTGGTSYKVGKALIQSQDQLKLMVAAGQSLKDLREVAGLTVNELSDAVNLKDKSILEAVENGTATLSFELILRLAALLARNDPIPFILQFSRTYSPDTWKVLNDWGAGRLPLHYERERQFINIYRSQDQARQLSDEGYNKVLEFTREAFNLSLHFIAEQEGALQDMLDAQEAQIKAIKRKMSNLKNHHTSSNTDNSHSNSDNSPLDDTNDQDDTSRAPNKS